MSKKFDAVGVGLNATDTMLLVGHFPQYGGKAPFKQEILSPGGQVASAIVTCQRLGLATKYIGSGGDDERGGDQCEGGDLDAGHGFAPPGAADRGVHTFCSRSRKASTMRPMTSVAAPGSISSRAAMKNRTLSNQVAVRRK